MSYEEMEYINGQGAERREKACRRAWMLDQAIRWGGWVLAAVLLLAQ